MRKVPTDLGPSGKALWREICKKMAADGAQPDARERQILHSACSLRDRIDQLEEQLTSEDVFTTGSKGQTVLHPAIVEIRNSHREIAQLLCRIDLEPFDDGGTSIGITLAPAMRSVKARNAAIARWGK